MPNEINLAEELEIPVIPIYAEHIQLPLWLRHLQFMDFVNSTPWMKLHGAIVSQIGKTRPSKPKKVITSAAQKDVLVEPVKIIKTQNIKTKPKHRSRRKNAKGLSWTSESDRDQYGQYADFQVDNVVQRFRLIEPGSFWMGSPDSEEGRELDCLRETRHRVKLSRSFWLADTACTQALWKTVLGTNPSIFKDNENKPVEKVSWDDVKELIQTLDRMQLVGSFSLPTEAQWEYACRAGTNTPFSFGDNINGDQVNYDGFSPYGNGKKSIYRGATVPVKSLPPNSRGLYEMHGNIWEWCEDAFQEDLGSEVCIDPKCKSGVGRIARGGSWHNYGGRVRSAVRCRFEQNYRNKNLGFRLSFAATA